MTTKDENFLSRVLCSGLDLNKKFRQYCKARWEENTAGLITADPENINKFYPEFSELYDYFFQFKYIREPVHPFNERYLNVSEMLSLKKDLEVSIMPFGFIIGPLTAGKFMDVFCIKPSVDNYYTESFLKILLEKAWKKIGVERERFWPGDLFYMSRGKKGLVPDPDDNSRYVAIILDEFEL